MIPALISTFSLAFFYFIGAIPAGIALGLSPLVVGLIAWLSYTLGVVLMVVIGTPLREKIVKHFGLTSSPAPESMLWRAWQRFGVLGLSVLSPVVVGAQIGAIIGLSLGVAPHRLIVGMSLGALLWCAILTLAVSLGVSIITG
jgi:hypothetical protein